MPPRAVTATATKREVFRAQGRAARRERPAQRRDRRSAGDCPRDREPQADALLRGGRRRSPRVSAERSARPPLIRRESALTPGEYRKGENRVGGAAGEIVFSTPPFGDLPELMRPSLAGSSIRRCGSRRQSLPRSPIWSSWRFTRSMTAMDGRPGRSAVCCCCAVATASTGSFHWTPTSTAIAVITSRRSMLLSARRMRLLMTRRPSSALPSAPSSAPQITFSTAFAVSAA